MKLVNQTKSEQTEFTLLLSLLDDLNCLPRCIHKILLCIFNWIKQDQSNFKSLSTPLSSSYVHWTFILHHFKGISRFSRHDQVISQSSWCKVLNFLMISCSIKDHFLKFQQISVSSNVKAG